MYKRGQLEVYQTLEFLKIPYEYFEHPPVETVKEASVYWKDLDAVHCKNLFLRNHKGNRHFLILIEFYRNLAIKELELRLKQGKITFASQQRLKKYLGVEPGSVSPFGLINDKEKHVHVFLDENLKKASKISFHPNDNTASLVIPFEGFLRYLQWAENSYEFISLSDTL